MANFEISYALVARAEGGYQNFRDDPGNYNSADQLVGTNWGISAKTYEGYVGTLPSEADMRSITKGEAKEIYRAVFWDRIKGGEILDQQIANIFFDGHVNHGVTGITLMQRVLKVSVDGIVGPETLLAINSKEAKAVFSGYKNARIEFYHRYADRRPEMRDRWLPVWLNRMDKFNYQSSGPGFPKPSLTTMTAGATPILILLGLMLLMSQPQWNQSPKRLRTRMM
ncbi:MAG: glycosyl hydrolase 108 family protein [Bacteroidota bacterium]